MKDIMGSFVIRNEGDGCLTSKYLEHTSTVPFTECCIRKASTVQEADDPFVGIYTTTWLEPGGRTSELIIQRNGNVYSLNWDTISNTTIRYRGSAMLFENKLIGCYWDL